MKPARGVKNNLHIKRGVLQIQKLISIQIIIKCFHDYPTVEKRSAFKSHSNMKAHTTSGVGVSAIRVAIVCSLILIPRGRGFLPKFSQQCAVSSKSILYLGSQAHNKLMKICLPGLMLYKMAMERGKEKKRNGIYHYSIFVDVRYSAYHETLFQPRQLVTPDWKLLPPG